MSDLPWWVLLLMLLGYVYFGTAAVIVVNPDEPKPSDGELNGPIGCFLFWPLVAVIYPWVVYFRRHAAAEQMTCTICTAVFDVESERGEAETLAQYKASYDALRGIAQRGSRKPWACSKCGADLSVALSKTATFQKWRVEHEATEAAKARAVAFNEAVRTEAAKNKETP